MLGCTIAVLVVHHWDEPVSWRHGVSAVAVLLASIEVLLLLGHHPDLSLFVKMFTTVSMTFFKLLLLFSVTLLLGFAFAFFLVFGGDVGTDNGKGLAFTTFPDPFLKVVAMMSGELDYGNLPFGASPWSSRFIFLTFLFLVTIVLFNLLNGLAVGDTQAIKSEVNSAA